MLKNLWILLVLLLVLSCLPAEGYTVVLKNGKVMKGTLVSESEENIVFKDEQGLQFSLKKSALDLEKMQEANAPPPEPPAPPAEPAQAATPKGPEKQAAKVYTAADLEGLRDKYGLSITPGDDGGMVDPSSPEGYYRGLMEAFGTITGVMNELTGVMDAMSTAWEIAASTGRDPEASLKAYKAEKGYADLTKSIGTNLSTLQSIRSVLDSPPGQYQRAYTAVGNAVDALYSYFAAIEQYNGQPPVPAFRMSMDSHGRTVDEALKELQAAPQPQMTEPLEPSTEGSGESEEPSTETPQVR